MAMARVELRPSGNHNYAIVVEDYQIADGTWRKKVIGSFGNAGVTANVQKAQMFAAAVNAGKSLLVASTNATPEDMKKALGLIVGTAIAALAITWLFQKK